MPGNAQEPLNREQRLDEAVTAFPEAQEAGRLAHRKEWLARYPEVAVELEQFFADQDEVDRLTGPLRTVLQGTPPPGDTPQPGSPDAAFSLLSPSALPSPPEGYELIQVLGQGGMGLVYKARQKDADRLVALKLIRADRLTSESDVQRFRNEAEAAAQLDHPHIVPVYEVGARPGHFFFSMKLIESGGLDAQLDRFRDDPRGAVRLVAQAARAVHHAHQRGILHRDLKPSNILLDCEGQPHGSDFGLAKRIEADGSLTQTGAIVGTPQYMAPEQTSGRKGAVTTATDVYGLGAV
jgi:serine/threonine-protein kinase